MTEAWKDRIFTNLGSLPLRSENPDDGYSVEDLVPHGWAPGGYVGPCRECKEFFVAAKRSRRCRPCAVTSLEAYRNRPPRRSEYWWVQWEEREGTLPLQPARIGFEGDRPITIEEIGLDIEREFATSEARLIERVLPAGRAAAVKSLSDAMWGLLHDMGAEGTSVCHSAKASARIAYEPFRVDADGDEAPLDYPLGEAESTLEEIRAGLRHELSRPMTVLPWSDEPVSPVIKIEGGEA